MHRYQGIAFRTACLVAGNAADAEEAAQVLDLGARHLENVLGRLLGGGEDGGDARADARG